jgi:putative ABC transport system substrate-binding protein
VLEVAGVTLIEVPADNATELEAELKGLGDIDIDAILVVPEPLLTAPDAFVVMGKFAAEHKIPIGGGPLSMGGYESIFNLPIDNVAVGKLAAPLADKILRGIPAATTPVVTPEIGLIINYKASQKLGLNVNEGLLARADEIIR